MTRIRELLPALIIGVAMACAPAFAGSQYVIVGAEPAAEGFAPGRILNLGETLDIPEGTIVTLLGEDGSVSAVPGPASVTVTDEGAKTGDAAAAQEKRSAISKIAGLLAGENKNASSLGVARSLAGKSGAQAIDDPWAVPALADGQGCVRGEAIVLGRAEISETLQITVTAGAGAAKDLIWKSGESLLALPSSIPVASPEIEVKTGGKAALIQLHLLPGDIDAENPVDALGWMITNGCNSQALALTRQLAEKKQ